METITVDDFGRVELRTARILAADRIESSEKLVKLRIELGGETRQLVAGIGRAYRLDELPGKTVIMVTNLAPRILMGVESQGMLLAATGEIGQPVLLTVDKPVESGVAVH